MANLRETVQERLKRMKQLSQINEANYSLVGGIEEDDEMPDLTEPQADPAMTGGDDPMAGGDPAAGDAMADPNAIAGGAEQPEDTSNDVADDGQMGVDVANAPSPDEETPEMGGDMGGEIAPEEPSVEEKQNEIIKLNISAMQKMQKVIDDLDRTVDSLNGKIGNLSAEVEEVREPTNVEKLMRRKEDSHPFYYNLNDMWEGNSFQARREVDGIRGIKKLEDGSYIADFDDLPKHTSSEIAKSFDMYMNESKKK